MTDKLRGAAQAIVDRWDSPNWGGSAENLKHTGEYIAALRAALAQKDATCKQNLQVWVQPNGAFSWEPQDERYWVRMVPNVPSQQDAQQKHKPLFAEMIAQHPGLAEDLAQQDEQAVPQGWIPPSGLKVADIGFRWDSDALQHVPHVLVEFAPVPANLPNTEKGWADRDAFVEMLNAAPTPPAQQPLGWLDRKAVECLQGAELNWMPAWNRPTSADPVPVFLGPPTRATLTASEILNMTPESIPAEHDGALLEYARAVIEAYERKNGISQPGYTAHDMASQGASQFRAGHDAAQSEIAELEQENRLLRARNDRLQKEIEQKGER